MDWYLAALIGAAGGAAMEAVDIIKSIKWHRQMPWNVQSDTVDPPRRRPDVRPSEENLPAPGWKAYCFAGLLRLFVSGALTGATAATFPQTTNPLVAFLVGLGALSAVQQAAYPGAVDGQECRSGRTERCNRGIAATTAGPSVTRT